MFHGHCRQNLKYQVGLLSTDTIMISAWNATNAHALDFVADDEMPLPVLETFVPRHDHYKVRQVSDVSV